MRHIFWAKNGSFLTILAVMGLGQKWSFLTFLTRSRSDFRQGSEAGPDLGQDLVFWSF